MNITAITTDFFQSNIYIISSDNSAVVIDPSGTQKFYDKIEDCLGCRQLKAILFTHGHFDHIALGHEFEGKSPCISTSMIVRCYTPLSLWAKNWVWRQNLFMRIMT